MEVRTTNLLRLNFYRTAIIFCTLYKLPAIKDKGAARRGRKEREQSHNDITASNDYRLTGKSPCRCIQPMCCLWLAYAVSQFLVRFFARCLAIRKCSSTHIHLLGIVSLVSINQRSFALILKEKVHWCCTILTPQCGRIGKRCVLSRAKVSI